MNKYQEDLGRIARLKLENGKVAEDFLPKTFRELQELVERAIPKKPIKNKMRQEKTSSLDKLFGPKDTYTCPNCGNALLEHYMNESQETRYCYDCG